MMKWNQSEQGSSSSETDLWLTEQLNPILAVSQDRVLEAPRLGLQLSIPFANKTGSKQAEQVKVG